MVDNTKKSTIATHDQDDLCDMILSKVCSNEPEAIDFILACISRLSASHSETNLCSAKVEQSLKEEDVDLRDRNCSMMPSSVTDIDSA